MVLIGRQRSAHSQMSMAMCSKRAVMTRSLHGPQQPLSTRTSHMKSRETIPIITLNACSHLDPAYRTNQLPTSLWHSIFSFDRLHVDRIRHAYFRNPYSAQEMSPMSFRRLFECSSFSGTEDTVDGVFGLNSALSAEPLTFRDVWYAIAVCTGMEIAKWLHSAQISR